MKIIAMKTSAWMLVLAMICTMLPMAVFAAGESVVFEADTSAYSAGVNPGDTVSVPIKVTTNNGFAGASLKIVYGEALTLTGVTAGDMGFTESRSENNYSVYTTANVTTTGTLATLNFTVNSDAAAGEVSVGVEGRYNDGTDVSDASSANVTFAVVPATLTINEVASTDPYTANISTTANNNTVVNGEDIVFNVNVGGTTGTFNSTQIVLKYDPAYLTYKSAATSSNDTQAPDYAVDSTNGTVTIRDYGEAITAADGVYTVTFTAAKGGETTVELTSAGFSTKDRAEQYDLLAATGVNELDVTINHKVTVNNADAGSVAPDGSFEYTIPGYDGTNNDYDITVTMGGEEQTAPTPDEDGKFTISNVTGDLEITYNETAKKYTVTFTDSTGDENGAVSNITGATLADGAYTVTHGTDITFDVPANLDPIGITDGYKYIVTVTETDDTAKIIDATSTDNENGLTYTIDGDLIEADITITITKETVDANAVTVTVNGNDLTMKDSEGNPLTSPATVVKGSDVVLTLTPETGYNYEVKVGEETVSLVDNQYTITDIQAAVTVTVTKTLDTSSVEVQQYVQLDGTVMWLVTINGNEDAQIAGKTYSYNGSNMYWSEQYAAYCYLVVAESLDADIAKAAIGNELVAQAATAVDYTMDVNISNTMDVNDAQLVWNMYSAEYSGFTTNVNMEKFLRADVNGSKTVDTSDAAAIITAIKNA